MTFAITHPHAHMKHKELTEHIKEAKGDIPGHTHIHVHGSGRRQLEHTHDHDHAHVALLDHDLLTAAR